MSGDAIASMEFQGFNNFEFGEGYQIKMIEEVTDFQFCSTVTGNNPDNQVDSNSNSLFGAWAIHSIYDFNISTGEWESQEFEDDGSQDVEFDAENIYLADGSSVCINLLDNSNVLQSGNCDYVGGYLWVYSFENEHIVTGEEGEFLIINDNGTAFWIYNLP